MHGGKGADVAARSHLHMTRQSGGVGQDVLVPEMAVVGHMGPGHEEVIVPHRGEAAAMLGAPMNRAVLPKYIPVADLQLGGGALKLQVLRFQTHGRMGEEDAVLADGRVGAHHHMASQHRASPNTAGAFHHTKGPDDDAFAQFRVLGDN